MCSNSNPYYRGGGGQSKMHFFFSELCPFFNSEKRFHFVISLLLLKIFTWNLEYVFTIQKVIYTMKGDNSKCIFFSELCPFFFFFTFYPLLSTQQPSIGTRMYAQDCLSSHNVSQNLL